MEKLPYSRAKDEFETLAGRSLWDDLDSYGKKSLLGLLNADSGFAEEFRAMSEMDALLSAHKPKISLISSSPSVFRFAAAALVALFLGGILFLSRDLIRMDRLSGGIATTGSCFFETAEKENGMIQNNSDDRFCDVSVGDTFRMRLLPEARARIQKKGNSLFAELRSGAVLIKGEKKKRDEEIVIYSGSNAIRFLGTSVFIQRETGGENDGLTVDVTQGSVQLEKSNQFFLSELSGISPEQREHLLKQDPYLFTVRSQIVERGQSIHIQEDKEKQKLASEAMTRLEKAAASGEVSPDIFRNWRQSLTPEEFMSLGSAGLSARTSAIEADREKTLNDSMQAATPPPVLIPSREERIQHEDSEIKTREIPATSPGQRNAGQWNNNALTETGPPHTVYTMDGRVLKGRAYQSGEEMVIESSGQIIRIPLKDVKRIENR